MASLTFDFSILVFNFNKHTISSLPSLPLSFNSHLGISFSPNFVTKERKGRCRGKVIRASLFGVGAPEALVIGVVALLVFGPKGLAEVARNLGKTLREFQPTIKELQEVSREFKSTLEREIGLDEISSQTQNTYSSKITNSASNPSSAGSTNISPTATDPNGAPSPNRAYTSEEYLKITEDQLKASAAEQQGTVNPSSRKSVGTRKSAWVTSARQRNCWCNASSRKSQKMKRKTHKKQSGEELLQLSIF
ncbi:hypothetical protein OIU78_016358 [Salix suchowensis]|nr:hypothetical protein OIU78_016358 [Salix suchowensis]